MKTAFATALVLATTALAQNLPSPNMPSVDPHVAVNQKSQIASRNDSKEARHEFKEGMKLKKQGHLADALSHFQKAADLDPKNVEYATARETTRLDAVMEQIQRGNKAMETNNTIEAQADYREALRVDPDNQFALQQLRNALPPVSPTNTSTHYSDDDSFSAPINLFPENVKKSFSYRGDSKALITQVMQAYGISADIDKDVKSRRVHFEIEPVDFLHASEALADVTKTFWVPLGMRRVMVMEDTPANRREFQRNALRTFYLPDVTTPTELQDIVNVFRVIFDIRFVVAQPSKNTITVRAPAEAINAATRFFDDLDSARPQVALDVSVYQVSGTLTRKLGIQPPQQFTTFALGPALSQLGSTNIQTLINNLISSGAINQANGTSIQALLAQALGGQTSSLFSTPFATYGGGLTLMALTLPGASLNLNFNKSDLQSLDHLTVHTAQNNPTTIKIGQRYPILNSTFSPIFNTSAIASVLGNGSYIAPFPSFNYEDLGLTVKATPSIQADRGVRIALEMQIRSLGAGTNNGIPIINNQEYKGTISLKDGEPGVVISYLTDSQSKTLTGVPGISELPVVGSLLRTKDVEGVESELLVIITPRILKIADPNTEAIALPKGT